MTGRGFDLIVLGVGMAGLTAAQKCARAGWSVAVVDSRPYGGTCALRGCDPKKMLRRGAEIVDAAERLAGKGFDLGSGHISWAELMAHKRSFTEPMPDHIERSLERAGATHLHGAARFSSPDTITVDGRELRGRHFLVATGARAIDCDLVVHGAGRVADIEELDLERAGIEATRYGIRVNEFLQSPANGAVYAAGDAAGTDGLPLTPVAVDEGSVVASNLLKGNHRKADYTGTPSVAFTIPGIVRIGLSEAKARTRHDNLRVVFQESGSWYSQWRVGETHSASKVIVDESTDLILGFHLLGHGYAEAANVFALAMQTGRSASQLRRYRSAYPGAASDVGSML